MNSKKDWTDSLPELLEGFTETEPEGLWDAVSSGMAPQRKRRIVPVWWYVAGAAAVAAAIAAVVLFWPAAPSAPDIVAPVPGIVVADTDETEPVVTPVDDDFVPQAVPGRHHHAAQPVSDYTEPAEEEAVTEDIPEETAPDNTDISETTEPTEPTGPESVETSETQEQTQPGITQPDENTNITVPPVEPQRRRRSFNPKAYVYYASSGYMGQTAASRSTGIGIPAIPGYKSAMVPETKAMGESGAVPSMLSRNKTSTTDSQHTQSSRKALGIVVTFDGHWGVESGVVFSDLTSAFTTTSGVSTSTTDRTVSYTGIPLYLRYNVFEWRKLGLYLNAGPMYEFTRKTVTTTSLYLGGELSDKVTDNTLYEDRKWSLNAGAGLQYRLFDHSALFIQPGFSYHFPDNSTLGTFYTEHPASYNLTFGLSLQF